MVSNATDAGKQLGFTPRLWRDKNPTTMRVNKGVAFNFVVDLQQLGDVLKEAEMPDTTLPNNLDGVKISVDIPASLSTAYGECKPAVGQEDPDHPRDSIPSLESGCIHLLQIPSPTVTAPPEFDPGQLAKIGLQFLGMSAEEAVNYSQSVDWTSTLVIPVPRGIVDSEQISIDGVTGNLLHSSEKTNETMPETYTLIWLKDGILYGLSGVNDPQTVIDIANNLE
jgi:hypothetical protein